MKVKVVEQESGFVLQLDPFEILHDVMSGGQHQELIESLSCAEDVIGHVCEQIISGYTYSGFSGSWTTGMDTVLQQARKNWPKTATMR